ncbi:MAG TPA: single-stranded DNA-binding protein [Actinospica sp.]|jgi:single-strand DNA-binding protein|nr:single-stranded DNA-binding protein [Actinospica sp.]
MSFTFIVGNVSDEPRLNFTANGSAVINFTVAETKRYMDRSTGEWKDGDTLFQRCYAWKNAGAENIAESINKGDRVMVTGELKQRSYTTDDGNKRQVTELEVTEIGPTLKYAQAKPTKNPRGNAGQTTQSSDPWATAAA